MSGARQMLIASSLCGVKHFANGSRISLLYLCNYRISLPSPLMRTPGEYSMRFVIFPGFGGSNNTRSSFNSGHLLQKVNSFEITKSVPV